MALLARNSRFDVALVIKLEIVRHNVNLHPWDRLAALIVIFQLFNIFLALLALAGYESAVAAHTGFLFWNRRIRRFTHRPVAILALHLVLLDVYNVAEVNRLIGLVAACARRWTEVVKVISDIEVPQGRLPIIVYPGANTDCGVCPCTRIGNRFTTAEPLGPPQATTAGLRDYSHESHNTRCQETDSYFCYHG